MVHLVAMMSSVFARPTLEELDTILNMQDQYDCNFNLKFSQNSTLEIQNTKAVVEYGNGKEAPGLVDILNDGTNACAFLVIKIADKIIHE